MTHITPRRPSGFNEYLPGDQIEFNRLLGIIRSTYEKYGFTPIDTPDIELSDILLAKGGGETEKQIYRFERGKNDLSLRFDLTIPLARYVAEHEHDLVFPFRRYHIGKVHRAERAQAGRFREFYQCDIDCIGSESPIIDAEFPVIINEIFEAFQFGEFTIRLNNRLILNGFFEGIGLKKQSADALRIVDKMEKISKKEFKQELKSIGLTTKQISQIETFTAIGGTNDEILHSLTDMGISSEDFTHGIEKLQLLIIALRAMGVPESRFIIDLKIARGLDYYTGTVYETILNDHPEVGSVCSGGRYDDLASHYTSTKLTGVGISIGLTRLFYQLKEAGIITSKQSNIARVIVMPLETTETAYAIEVAHQLRNSNIPTILYTEPVSMKKKMKYADKSGVQYIAILGNQELADRTVSLKNMYTGESQTIALPALMPSIR